MFRNDPAHSGIYSTGVPQFHGVRKLLVIDILTKKPLWTFQSEGSRQNIAALSKPDGSPNYEAVFASLFYDDLIVGVNKMHAVGMFLSSPVISGSAIYIGSTDGNLYALE
jgi:outer membrane protein assembly factor BamB